MRFSDFKDAQRNWDIEVEAEAVELIESGTPPYDAIDQARNIVSRRRRQRRASEEGKESK
jgi:hypothetical protein